MELLNFIKKYIVFIIVLITNNNISFAQFGGGNGTQAEPYEIYTIEHLMALSDSVESSPSNDAATDYNWSKDKYFILMKDIPDSVKFNIGLFTGYYNYEEYFQGNFDGNNKQIILALNGKQKLINGVWTHVWNHFLGLFAGIYSASIHHLNLTGYIKGESYMGGICGINVRSNILNCVNRCNIENYEPTSLSDNRNNVGGFCGEAYLCNILNCVNYGDITAYGWNIGGIAGYTNSAIATNCTNYGNITGHLYFTAGIFGLASGVLYGDTNATGCFSCHNYGNVSGGVDAAGGIIGCVLRSVSISNCTNSGVITAEGWSGGIAGHTHMGIEISHCINIGTVQGNISVGGITGGHQVPLQDSGGYINTCHNAGLVIGKDIVGGIQGSCWGGEISNSLNTGVVIGETNVGGIVGEAKKDDIILRDAIIKNCYYDKQMCIHGGIAGQDIAGQAEGYLTKELIGNNLQAKLGSADWTYSSLNLYPILSHFIQDTIAFIAISPTYLYNETDDFDRHNKVKTDFKVNLENDVKWDRIIGNVDIVNEDGLVRNSGSDTLVCSIGSYKKAVPINITLQPIGDVKFTIWATEHKQVAPTSSNYHIPIYVKANAKTLQEIVIKKLTIEIDKNLFYLKRVDNNVTVNSNGNEITIENVQIPKLNACEEVVLFNIIGDVLLGTVDSSGIIINPNVEFAEELNTEPELKNGYITLNICREGSDRLIEIAGNSPSLSIKNNPVNDILEVECNVVESGKYMLEVVDMAGRSVKVEEFVAGGTGVFQFEIDVANFFNAGKYITVMRTPSGRMYSAEVVLK